MDVELDDGSRYSASHDAGIPEQSVEKQGHRIDAKFLGLATPMMGSVRAEEILSTVHRLEQLSSVSELTRLLVPTAK